MACLNHWEEEECLLCIAEREHGEKLHWKGFSLNTPHMFLDNLASEAGWQDSHEVHQGEVHMILTHYWIVIKDPSITLCLSSAWEREKGRNGVCVLLLYEQVNMSGFPFAFPDRGQLESRLSIQEWACSLWQHIFRGKKLKQNQNYKKIIRRNNVQKLPLTPIWKSYINLVIWGKIFAKG